MSILMNLTDPSRLRISQISKDQWRKFRELKLPEIAFIKHDAIPPTQRSVFSKGCAVGELSADAGVEPGLGMGRG
jgi:hypothetical protein